MKKMQDGGLRYDLGLDIGVASIGWAMVVPEEGKTSGRVIGLGSHLFEAGTDGTESDIAGGKDEPKGQQRRMARQARRMIWRRARRKR